VSSEFLASLRKNFRGRGILNHTPVLCDTVSWVQITWFTSQPRKPRKFYPSKNTRYTVFASHKLVFSASFVSALCKCTPYRIGTLHALSCSKQWTCTYSGSQIQSIAICSSNIIPTSALQ